MGRVYEAVDTELDEKVALKVLRSGLTDDAIERFRREVKLTRRIQHRNVARMFDIGEHGRERFLTMELVAGEPLRVDTTPLPWSQLKAIAEQICAGLAAAHATGVIHRDLKPDNVLVERGTDRAVITDFGIARRADDPTVTQVGEVIGTPRYMAPEQLAGREIDARADLFSLGVMLYELATGTRPWPGDNAIGIAVAQATIPLRALDHTSPELPLPFMTLLAALLQLDPQKRPASATEVGAAIASGTGLVDHAPETKISRPSRPSAPPELARPSAASIAPETTSLAVLPVQCVPGDEYLADGVRDDLTDSLSTSPGVRVRPTGHVGADLDPREIGRLLAVDHIVVATLRRTPTGLRVAARLIGVNDGFQIWAHKRDCTQGEILAVSDELAQGIAIALSTRASTSTRPTDPRAVELYLRARAEMRRFWGGHVQAATDMLEQAVEYAPTSPPILSAYAMAAVQAWVMRSLPELAVRARGAIDRALATGHGEAYLAAAVYWINQGDPERGMKNLGIALVRAPMSAHAHELAGRMLVEVEGPVSGRLHLETACGLDPGRRQIINGDLARLDALERDWPTADQRVANLLADPDPPLVQLGAVFEARLSVWRHDLSGLTRATARLPPRLSETANKIGELLDAAVKGVVELDVWRRFIATFTTSDRPVRQQILGLQLIAEIAVLVHNHEIALEALSHASRFGLLDVVWLDRCPLFSELYETAGFATIRSEVAARAQRTLAAFRSTAS